MTRIVTAVALLCASIAQAKPDPELTDHGFLSEIARYLYAWHLDEHDVSPSIHEGEFVFWVRQIDKPLDEGDESRFAEVTLPRVGVRLDLKKANYHIPELDIHVVNESYKIVSGERLDEAPAPPEGAVEVVIPYDEMRAYLFRTRAQLAPPEGNLLEQMKTAAFNEISEHYEATGEELPVGRQITHIGPVSPVANEIWVYWQTGRLLLRFHSDMDLAHPGVLEHDELSLELYDIDEQVVVSLDEVAGSNAYLTRDHVGRILFNCMTHGETIVNEDPSAQASSPEPDEQP